MVGGAAFPSGSNKVWPSTLQGSTIGLWIARVICRLTLTRRHIRAVLCAKAARFNAIGQGRLTGYMKPCIARMDAQAAQV